MMTILDEFIQATNRVIRIYEKNHRDMSMTRAKEIAELRAELDNKHTALSLRRAVVVKTDHMSGIQLNFLIAVDSNELRKQLRQLLKEEKFSLLNMLVVENSEMQGDKMQLIQSISSLKYSMETNALESNPKIAQLEEAVGDLGKRLEEQEAICIRYQVENKFLSEQLVQTEHELAQCKAKLLAEEEKSAQFYGQLLVKMQELMEAKATIAALKQKQVQGEENTTRSTQLRSTDKYSYSSFYA